MTRSVISLLFIAILPLLYAPNVQCQTLTSNNTSEQPIEIEATTGIEWERDKQIVRALGDARATRGDLSVNADTLTAHYREDAAGNTAIWQIDAVGNVEIASSGHVAYADAGTYDVESGVLDLTAAERVKLITTDGELSATDNVRFFANEAKLVATGNAEAIRGDRRLNAPVLTIFVAEDASGESRIERMEAENGVQITTPEERITGDSARYNADTGIARVNGSVKITRGPNQLNGCVAEVNLNTGISSLFGCPGASGKSQAKGLIQPRER